MRYEAVIAAVLILSQVAASSAATAETRDNATSATVNAASPQFSAAETGIVGRNEILRTLIETDPWLVREILDAIAQHGARDAAFDGDAFVGTALYTGNGAEAADPGRSAAASVEWLALLRQVKDEKATRDKQTSSRSAKGSVELLESLKKAKKEKGSGK